MRGRSACMAFGAVLLCLPLIACSGGNDEAAGLPTKGSEVCEAVRGTERFRYTLSYVIDSPQQENPPAEAPPGDPTGSYAIKPSHPDFRFETTHSGAAVRPDRLDLEISTTPDQPSVRTIRIGQSQWYLLGETWQVVTEPIAFPFTPPNVCDVLVEPLDLSGKTADLQSVGDTEARHVRIDGVPSSASPQLFGPASDMGRLLTSYDIDLWLDKNNDRVVKVEAVSKAVYPYGRELSAIIVMDVGSYNDDDIEIQPPLEG